MIYPAGSFSSCYLVAVNVRTVTLSGVFLLAVLAPISFRLLIRKIEHMRKFLFNGGNAARIFALDHIGDGLRKA